jgi:hypothetical protein
VRFNTDGIIERETVRPTRAARRHSLLGGVNTVACGQYPADALIYAPRRGRTNGGHGFAFRPTAGTVQFDAGGDCGCHGAPIPCATSKVAMIRLAPPAATHDSAQKSEQHE